MCTCGNVEPVLAINPCMVGCDIVYCAVYCVLIVRKRLFV